MTTLQTRLDPVILDDRETREGSLPFGDHGVDRVPIRTASIGEADRMVAVFPGINW